MRNFTFIAALLCTVRWISVSVSEFVTMEVQPGAEVTLTCNNFSGAASNIFWYRMTCGGSASCISSMRGSEAKVSLCKGFHQDKFHMESNGTKLSLKIKSVDVSDSGMYFCGCCEGGPPIAHRPQYLNVQGDTESDNDTDCESQKKSDENTNLMVVILGGLTVFLVMVVIGLVVKIKTVQKGTFENLLYLIFYLNYAPLSFHPKMNSSQRPEREMQSTVVYAATR
uniref:Uncharacterized LOC110971792 n=1 Tax=Acanthochromis polyacanthus TaxID=80966 RepID=A0A3Q1GQ74_9TELE